MNTINPRSLALAGIGRQLSVNCDLLALADPSEIFYSRLAFTGEPFNAIQYIRFNYLPATKMGEGLKDLVEPRDLFIFPEDKGICLGCLARLEEKRIVGSCPHCYEPLNFKGRKIIEDISNIIRTKPYGSEQELLYSFIYQLIKRTGLL